MSPRCQTCRGGMTPAAGRPQWQPQLPGSPRPGCCPHHPCNAARDRESTNNQIYLTWQFSISSSLVRPNGPRIYPRPSLSLSSEWSLNTSIPQCQCQLSSQDPSCSRLSCNDLHSEPQQPGPGSLVTSPGDSVAWTLTSPPCHQAPPGNAATL